MHVMNPFGFTPAGHRLKASVGFMPAGPRLFSYQIRQNPNIFLPPSGRKKDIGESDVQP